MARLSPRCPFFPIVDSPVTTNSVSFSRMANTTIIQIIDNEATGLKYSDGQWSHNTLSSWYNGTAFFPMTSTGNGFLGSFSVEFEGTSIAFVGTIPIRGLSQNATVSIDGAPAYQILYPTVASSPIYLQWYKTPALPPGKHNVTVNEIDAASLDLAFVELSPNTNMAGKTVFVDDDDPGIQYSIAWARNTDGLNGGTNSSAFPLGNTTHRCTTHDSTFSYDFEGTAISLYGVFGWNLLGSLTVSYSIDDRTPVSQSYTVDENTPQFKNNVGNVFNFPFFTQDGLPAQKHTLLVTVIPVGAQVFMFDYMTYAPFSNLTSVPGDSSATSIASSVNGGPTGSIVPGSVVKRSTSSIGPVVGGVVGGINLLLFIGLLIFWIRRRRSSRSPESVSYPQDGSGFTGTNPSYNQAKGVALTVPQLSPLRPGFIQSAPLITSYSDELLKVLSTPPQNLPPNTNSENLLDDLARRERLFNFGPRPTPVRAGNHDEPRVNMLGDDPNYDRKVSISPRLPDAAAPALPPPLNDSTSSTSIIYPTPSQTPAPPAYDALSTHRPSTRRPPTYRRTHIPDST